jgi:hypothetical protein
MKEKGNFSNGFTGACRLAGRYGILFFMQAFVIGSDWFRFWYWPKTNRWASA